MYKIEFYDVYQKTKFRIFGWTLGTIVKNGLHWSKTINLKPYTKHFAITNVIDIIAKEEANRISVRVGAFGMEYVLIDQEILPNGGLSRTFELDRWNQNRFYVSGKFKITYI